jgi:hypothetical protein
MTRESGWLPQRSARPAEPMATRGAKLGLTSPRSSASSRRRRSGHLRNPPGPVRRARSRRARSGRRETTYGLGSQRACRAGAIGPAHVTARRRDLRPGRNRTQSPPRLRSRSRVEAAGGTGYDMPGRVAGRPAITACPGRLRAIRPLPAEEAEQPKTAAARMCSVRTDGNRSDVGGRETRSSSDGPRSRPPEVDSRRPLPIEAIGRRHRQHLSASVGDDEMSVHRSRSSIHSEGVRIAEPGDSRGSGAGRGG